MTSCVLFIVSSSAGLAKNPNSHGVHNYSPTSEPETVRPSDRDRQLIFVHRRTAGTDEMVQYALKGISLMPEDVKQNLIDNGVTVVITPTRTELLGTRGGACYDFKLKRVVIPVLNDATNTPVDKQMIARVVLLHELGHAYDHTNGKISFRPAFLSMYEAEEKMVPESKRKLLAYFLEEADQSEQETRPHRPPQECFASLFASRFAKANLPRLKSLRESFPRCAAYVTGLRP